MYRVLLFFFFCAATVAFENRIAGGRDTVIKRRPYQVSFETLYTHTYYCGGSIISPIYIVTAAHCGVNPEDTAVRLKTNKVGRGGVLHTIKSVIEHPNYNYFAPVDNDIAIVELQNPIEFSAAAQPIPLAKNSEKLPVGTIVSVSGWGFLDYDTEEEPAQLQVVEVPIVDHKQCTQALATASKEVTESMICAGYFKDGGKDSCTNDSGGPLVFRGKLYGIVSWGIECARPGFPGVYSNVAYLRDFITQVTGL